MKKGRAYYPLLTVVSTLLLCVFFALGVGFFFSNAQEETDSHYYKYFTSILIYPKDTLWSITETYADEEHYPDRQKYIDEVIHINGLQEEEIQAGEYLIVPYYSSEYK